MLFGIRVTHVTTCVLLIHGNQHSQHSKNYENWKIKNKMEADTEDSTVQLFKAQKIEKSI